MADLLNVDTAIENILKTINTLPAEYVDLPKSLGRVLADNITSPIDLPAFRNSAMDGYAVVASDTLEAEADKPIYLPLVMDIPAGKVAPAPLQPGQAARIMTGAPIPEGATAVIPVEDTNTPWDRSDDGTLPEYVSLRKSVTENTNIRPVGENIRKGSMVLEKGTVIRAAEIGILASLGHVQIPVIVRPKVAILSTGDELAAIDQPLKPGQIRDVNSYTLSALVTSYGGEAVVLPIARDRLSAIRELFNNALSHKPDLIISSAGVSVGAADLIRSVLNELGEINFWRINIRPGKPLAYGQIRNIPFFGLPGNPVSAMVTFEVLVRPALFKMMGQSDQRTELTVKVGEEIHSDGRRSYLRVMLKEIDGSLVAYQTGTQSSGALLSMVLADALLIIPEGTKYVQSGSTLRARILR